EPADAGAVEALSVYPWDGVLGHSAKWPRPSAELKVLAGEPLTPKKALLGHADRDMNPPGLTGTGWQRLAHVHAKTGRGIPGHQPALTGGHGRLRWGTRAIASPGSDP